MNLETPYMKRSANKVYDGRVVMTASTMLARHLPALEISICVGFFHWLIFQVDPVFKWVPGKVTESKGSSVKRFIAALGLLLDFDVVTSSIVVSES